MAAATLPLSLWINPTRLSASHSLSLSLSLTYPLRRQPCSFPPIPRLNIRTKRTISSAYVTGPASDPIVSEPGPKLDDSDSPRLEIKPPPPPNLIGWGLLWSLLSMHKLRLGFAILALAGASTCTLSMPIFSGRFFEVLIGARPEPLWRLLSKIGVLYALEPIFTVVFVVNMNTIWEKVMSTIRAQIFTRVLIQKAEFFDRYKVGELSGLLTSDLGSLKDVVSENISRDRGFRALSEARHSILSESELCTAEIQPIVRYIQS